MPARPSSFAGIRLDEIGQRHPQLDILLAERISSSRGHGNRCRCMSRVLTTDPSRRKGSSASSTIKVASSVALMTARDQDQARPNRTTQHRRLMAWMRRRRTAARIAGVHFGRMDNQTLVTIPAKAAGRSAITPAERWSPSAAAALVSPKLSNRRICGR